MEEKEKILEIIENIQSGKIYSLNELYHVWPETISNSEFFESIYNDTESIIEHSVIKNKNANEIDEVLFLKSIDFRNFIIDYMILKLDIEIKMMIKLRNEFRKKSDLTLIDFDRKLSQYRNSKK